jgi:capsule polysaccharide export protein KpsE/RkpR
VNHVAHPELLYTTGCAAEMLKQLIAHLQQMLAKLQAQIAAASTRHGAGGSPNPALSSVQAEASVIQGQIFTATAKMAELLKSQGQTIGSLVNDQA